jgi:hypothetical protein
MKTVDYIQALISECSTYEEGLASQPAKARQNAPGRVGCLVDLIHGQAGKGATHRSWPQNQHREIH